MIRRALAIAALLVALPAAPAAAQERPTARLALASQTTWVDGDGTFSLRLDVDAVRRPQQLELVVTLHRAVRTRSQFNRTVAGELLGSSIDTTSTPFDELRFDPSGAVLRTVDAEELRPGVYPVVVELVDTETDEPVASLVTHLVKVPSDEVEIPLHVAWVQPYGAAPALQPSGEVELSDSDLDDLRTIAAQLGRGVPLTVTPTPETIAALDALDGGQTVAALAALLAEHQVVSTTYVDLDEGAIVDADRDEDIGRQRLEGDAVLDDSLRLTGDNRSWSLTGTVTRAALRAVADLGVRQVVVDESALEPLPSSITRDITLARPFAIEGSGGTVLDAVAVDGGLSAHFEDSDEVLAAHRMLADLAVLHFDSPGAQRGIVIRPPVDWRPSGTFLLTVLGGLATSPLHAPVTLDALFDVVEPLADGDDDPVVREVASSQPGDLDFSSGDLDRARAAMEGLASLLVDPSDADLDLLDRLLLVAESADLPESTPPRYIDAVIDRVRAATTNIRVAGDRTYRLTAREGTIPLTIVNDNDFAVQVDVELTSEQIDFTGSDSVGRLVLRGLVLAPSRSTTQAVDVTARTSGRFNLRVTVQSPGGRLDLGAASYTVTSTVASGVGILLSVGAGLFLLLWWGSHWRTVRRARRLVEPE